ncbi:MAG: type II toxin-antitoxin system RelE/ParE family toxin [Rhodospirillales bacterium]|nr:type II toxin-antitoxin system RelE/ParE family toxin [Rhodospirillales bacterium]
MAWRIEFDEAAAEELAELDRAIAKRVVKLLKDRLANQSDPRRIGHALHHDLAGLWRYRVGDWRLVCRIEDASKTILVLRVGHRREVYRA